MRKKILSLFLLLNSVWFVCATPAIVLASFEVENGCSRVKLPINPCAFQGGSANCTITYTDSEAAASYQQCMKGNHIPEDNCELIQGGGECVRSSSNCSPERTAGTCTDRYGNFEGICCRKTDIANVPSIWEAHHGLDQHVSLADKIDEGLEDLDEWHKEEFTPWAVDNPIIGGSIRRIAHLYISASQRVQGDAATEQAMIAIAEGRPEDCPTGDIVCLAFAGCTEGATGGCVKNAAPLAITTGAIVATTYVTAPVVANTANNFTLQISVRGSVYITGETGVVAVTGNRIATNPTVQNFWNSQLVPSFNITTGQGVTAARILGQQYFTAQGAAESGIPMGAVDFGGLNFALGDFGNLGDDVISVNPGSYGPNQLSSGDVFGLTGDVVDATSQASGGEFCGSPEACLQMATSTLAY